MSTITNPTSPATGDDPFRYGWRDVPRHGSAETVRIPLTLEDVLHPQRGDVIVESSLHDLMRAYLADVFRARTAHDPTALVLSNVGIYWDDEDLKHHSPDDAVIFGVREQKFNWTSFNVAEEKVRPTCLVEIVSPSTRSNDVEIKLHQYHLAQVPIYIIVDQKREGAEYELRGYRNTPDGFVELAKDAQGRLWLEPLNLFLGMKNGRVVCYDGVTNQEIGDYTRISQELASERARADAEKARADAEKVRADAEKARADTLAERIRELEKLIAPRSNGAAEK